MMFLGKRPCLRAVKNRVTEFERPIKFSSKLKVKSDVQAAKAQRLRGMCLRVWETIGSDRYKWTIIE